jgi:hypothetical protein
LNAILNRAAFALLALAAAACQSAHALDPRNATYRIDGVEYTLVDGQSAVQAAPGFSMKIRTLIVGDPVQGDVDGDGGMDFAVALVHQPGGSGTFYYAAVLSAEGDHQRAVNAILLGDRIRIESLTLRNSYLRVDFLDRAAGDAMAKEPTLPRVALCGVHGTQLDSARVLTPDEEFFEGWLTLGHEVRTLNPCSESEEWWLEGDAIQMADMRARYDDALTGVAPYTPVHAALIGQRAPAPISGFGTDYTAAFRIASVVSLSPLANCASEWIVIGEPRPGAAITSPLTVSGRARGNWFAEGDFPINIVADDGAVVGSGYGSAQGEWMTTDFVKFRGAITFDATLKTAGGQLVLKRNNPSENRALDMSINLPIRFKQTE